MHPRNGGQHNGGSSGSDGMRQENSVSGGSAASSAGSDSVSSLIHWNPHSAPAPFVGGVVHPGADALHPSAEHQQVPNLLNKMDPGGYDVAAMQHQHLLPHHPHAAPHLVAAPHQLGPNATPAGAQALEGRPPSTSPITTTGAGTKSKKSKSNHHNNNKVEFDQVWPLIQHYRIAFCLSE